MAAKIAKIALESGWMGSKYFSVEKIALGSEQKSRRKELRLKWASRDCDILGPAGRTVDAVYPLWYLMCPFFTPLEPYRCTIC